MPAKNHAHAVFGDCLATVVLGGIVTALTVGFLLHGFAATLYAVGDAFRWAFGS